MASRRLIPLTSLAVLALALAGCGRKAPASPAGQGERPSVTLSWDASTSQVSGYHVYRTTNPNAEPGLLAITPADVTRYVDTAVEAGRTYYYSVKAFDSTGAESEPSVKISATIPAK